MIALTIPLSADPAMITTTMIPSIQSMFGVANMVFDKFASSTSARAEARGSVRYPFCSAGPSPRPMESRIPVSAWMFFKR